MSSVMGQTRAKLLPIMCFYVLIQTLGLVNEMEGAMKALDSDRQLETAVECFRFNVPLEFDVRAAVGIDGCPVLRRAADVVSAFEEMAKLPEEVLIAAALDSSFRLIRWNVVATGDQIWSGFRRIDAFHAAIISKARSIILIQSRLSSDYRPTSKDSVVTKAILETGRLLGYPLIDHVILNDRGYWNLEPRRQSITFTAPRAVIHRRTRTMASSEQQLWRASICAKH
jgi:hypothetical protein